MLELKYIIIPTTLRYLKLSLQGSLLAFEGKAPLLAIVAFGVASSYPIAPMTRSIKPFWVSEIVPSDQSTINVDFKDACNVIFVM